MRLYFTGGRMHAHMQRKTRSVDPAGQRRAESGGCFSAVLAGGRRFLALLATAARARANSY